MGSEMCIRDSPRTSRPGQRKLEPLEQTGGSEGRSSPMQLSQVSQIAKGGKKDEILEKIKIFI